MTLVVSNGEVDRYGDAISPDGCRLDSYERNPVFLLAHGYTRPMIGRVLSASKEPQHLLARMDFAPTVSLESWPGSIAVDTSEVRSTLVRNKELFDHQPHPQFFTTPLLL